jgi:hypothetical protein
MNNSHFRISAWHGGRRTDDNLFKQSFADYCQNLGYESRSRKDSEYITVEDESLVIQAFNDILAGFKNQQITVTA